MAVRYKVHLSDQKGVEIDAETINLGVNKLWFYDSENNLLAAFRWDNILGFSVEGSASAQKVTERLLHDKSDNVDELEKTYGPVIAAVDRARQQLEALERAATHAWLKIYDAKKEPQQIEFVLSKHPDRLRDGFIRLADYQRTLPPKMKQMLDDLDALFPKSK
jgi:hypothetical protein